MVLGVLGFSAPAQAAVITVSGHVIRTPDGSPVVGVEVRAYDGLTGSTMSTTTDAQGYYSISGVESDALTVCADQQVPSADKTVRQACDGYQGSATIDLRMDRVTTVTGTVQTVANGSLHWSNQVGLYESNRYGGWFLSAQATVDSQSGAFQFTEVPDGNYRLCVVGEDIIAAAGCFGGSRIEDGDDVLVRGTPLTRNFSDVATGRVKGSLFSGSGAGIEPSGAIRIYRVIPDGRGGSFTQEIGYRSVDSKNYSIDLTPGRYRLSYELQDNAGPYRPIWNGGAATIDTAPDLVVTSGGTSTVNVNATRAASISGHLTLPEGQSYAAVTAVSLATGARSDGFAYEDGNYSIDGLAAGSYRVEFDRVSGSSGTAAEFYTEKLESEGISAATSLSATSGQQTSGVDNTLGAGATASGVVSTADGTAVKNARILLYTDDEHLRTRSAKTSETGAFSVTGLQVSSYKIAVDLRGPYGLYFLDASGQLSSARSDATLRSVGASGLALGALTLPSSHPSGAPHLLTRPSISGTSSVGSTLTADPGTWTEPGLTFSYRWLREGEWPGRYTSIVGATGATYVPTNQDAGHRLRVEVFTSKPGTRESYATADLDDPVGSLPRLRNQTSPTLTPSQPVVGQAVSISGGSWSATPTTTTYQWFRNDAPIKGATAASYTPIPDDQYQTLSVVEVVQRSGYLQGSVEVRAEAPTRSSGSQPSVVNTAPPTVSGTPQVGSTLTSTPGSWSTSGLTYAYAWLADGTPISGATASTLVITSAQTGKRLSVQVTASRPGYTSGIAESTKTTVVTGGALVNTSKPTISGSAVFGQTLTTSNGSWNESSGLTYTYQWLADEAPISGATASSYTLGAGEVDKKVSVKVTAAKSGFTPATSESLQTTAVARAQTTNTAKPAITGTPRAGSTLSASSGSWSPAGALSYDYQWYAGGTAVPGATSATYAVAGGDVGKKITVQVAASRPGYTTAYATSAPTKAVTAAALTSTSPPTVSGTPRVDSTLSASTGTWSETSGVTYSYQWYAGKSPISGATASTFVVGAQQVKLSISVQVTATKAGYAPATATSAATAKVEPATFTVVSQPSIAGSTPPASPQGTPTATVGTTLSHQPGSVSPSASSYTLLWLRNGKSTKVSTETYTVTAADKGKTVTLKVTYSRPGYTSLTVTTGGVAVAAN